MEIFNFKIIVREATPEPGISELNSVIIGEPVDGVIEGVQFLVRYAGLLFDVAQCPDEHTIFLVPDGAESIEDSILVFQHNPYDEKYDILDRHVSPEEAKVLRDLWLIRIEPEWVDLQDTHTRLVEV